jgi:hypothetical protein
LEPASASRSGWDRAPARLLQVEGYQSRSFDCEVGSHFHHGHVSGGPAIIPDDRFSHVRFETLAIFWWAFPSSQRLKRWFVYAPFAPGLPPASSPGQHPATAPVLSSRPPTVTWKPPSSRAPLANLGVTSIGETCFHLLRGHYPTVIAPTSSCVHPLASPILRFLASFQESLQVATQPLLPMDVSDVISASLSPDACPQARRSHRVHLPVSSPMSSAFPRPFLGRLPACSTNAIFRGEVSRLADIPLCSSL